MFVYFDNSATTRPYDSVIEATAEAMREFYGNPSSVHMLGMMAEKKLTECREALGKTINATKDEILFNSGGSESNNFLIRAYAHSGNHIITTKTEHPSVLKIFEHLESQGVKTTYLDVDEFGIINVEQLKNSINKDTTLVSIMHVNNEIGTIANLREIGKVIKESSSRAKFHVDAVQSYGKIPIDVKEMKIDMLSTSAHKIHGPRGIGFSYIKKGLNPKPFIHGGGQEFGFRAGTQNLPAAVGYTVAAMEILLHREDKYQKVEELKAYFVEKLKLFKDVRINSPINADFTPYILSVSFKGIRSEVLLRMLEEKGICVSAGSACSSKKDTVSHVLKSIGLPKDYIDGTIRFSFNSDNTKEEVDYVVSVLENSIKFLRRFKR